MLLLPFWSYTSRAFGSYIPPETNIETTFEWSRSSLNFRFNVCLHKQCLPRLSMWKGMCDSEVPPLEFSLIRDTRSSIGSWTHEHAVKYQYLRTSLAQPTTFCSSKCIPYCVRTDLAYLLKCLVLYSQVTFAREKVTFFILVTCCERTHAHR